MSNQGLSIAEAARKLGVSTKTIRRFIKAGKIQARMIPGPFGEEYRIDELAPELMKKGGEPEVSSRSAKEAPAKPAAKSKENNSTMTQTAPSANQESAESPTQLTDIIKKLQETNMTLAAQLGAAMERIRNLENQVKLIAAPQPYKLPWWKRLFRFGR
jgi:MerR family transcriptional regulator, copper efflux regulator